MKKGTDNIDDLFAAARNADVKITLEQVQNNLSQHVASTAGIQWAKLTLGIMSVVVVTTAIVWYNTKTTRPAASITNASIAGSKPTSHVPTINNYTEETKSQPTIFSQSKSENKTTKKTNPKTINTPPQVVVGGAMLKKFYAENTIRPIVANNLLNSNANSQQEPIKLLEWKPSKRAATMEMPLTTLHTLGDPKLSFPKHEIHFMESVESGAIVSLRSAKKGNNTFWLLDRYDEQLNLLESKDVSDLFKNKKSGFYKMVTYDNQLLLVVSHKSGKGTTYQSHLIHKSNFDVQASETLITVPNSKVSNPFKIDIAENEQYLLVKQLPKHRDNISQKQLQERAIFKVFDKQLKLVYQVTKPAMQNAKTTVDNKGQLYVWKPSIKAFDGRFVSSNIAMQNILYRFDSQQKDSFVVKKNSFKNIGNNIMKEFALSNHDKGAVFNKIPEARFYRMDSIELQGLRLTVSPEGMPILYGYLKNMEGLQYLAFDDIDLSPFQQSLLVFNRHYDDKQLPDGVVAPSELKFKPDNMFFDAIGNFYVLSSSYYLNYLPLMAQEKERYQIEYSDKFPIPYYKSWDVYVHQFNAQGIPVMTAKVDNNEAGKQTDKEIYSYLFKDNYCSIIHLDKTKNNVSDNAIPQGKTTAKNLTIAAVQTDGQVIHLQVNNNTDIPIEDYQPIEYFHNQRETLVLLKDSNNAYTIGRLYYEED